jgi:molecular chaperone Hsp33
MKKNKRRFSTKFQQIDVVLTGLIHNNSLRCAIAITTESTRTAQEKHGLDPLATLALGRAFACTALMGSGIKNDLHFVHCCIDGGGPLGPVVAEFIAPASLRGYVGHPRLLDTLKPGDPIPQSVGEAVGQSGTVTIRRGETGKSEPYSGVSALVSGEIAQDIAQYFLESEQIPTIVAAGVKLGKHGEVLGAGGILVQKVGGQEIEDGVLQEFENKFANDFNLSHRIAAGVTAEEIMRDLVGTEYQNVQAEAIPIGFHCFCSRDRMATTLMGLGEKELRSIVADVGKLEMKCHYCAAVSKFELQELLQH